MTLDGSTLGSLMFAAAGLAGVLMAVDAMGRARRATVARIDRYAPRPGTAARAKGLGERIADALAPAMEAARAALFAREKDRAQMSRLMTAAGLGGRMTLSRLAAAKLVAAAVGAGAGWAMIGRFGPDGPAMAVMLVAGGGVGGSLAPEMALRALATARSDRLRAALPDAIDLLVISSQAGLSLDMAMSRVAREMQGFAPELATELQTCTAEMQALPERADALLNFATRTDLAEVKAFSMTLVQSVRHGSPYSEALRALGADLRAQRMLAAEERSARLPALLTLPLILFIMPAVFIVVIGPAVISMSTMFGR